MSRRSTQIRIAAEMDIARAVLQAGNVSCAVGFDENDRCTISTAVSELARNILRYASRGEVVITPLDDAGRAGVEIEARDRGPGIEDVERALQDHYTSSQQSLGMGLPGVRRLMDDFEIDTAPGRGTRVTVRKWR